MTNENFTPTTVPQFNITATQLREVCDQVADFAMQGLDQMKIIESTAPAELRPALAYIAALFGQIGFSVDSTADDATENPSEVWGIAAA